MGCGTSFVKYVLFFFNLLVALVGLAMLGLGIAVILKWNAIQEVQNHLTIAPWVFIVIGAIVFIIAFFGCCGAIRESHCMIVTYAIFLLVIIIAEVVLAVLLFTHSDSLKTGVDNGIVTLFGKSRSGDQAAVKLFENIEIQLECCGESGPISYNGNVPSSCCTQDGIVNNYIPCNPLTANKIGCRSRVGELVEKWSKYIAGVAIGVACVEVVGALFALCLANSIRNMDRRYA